MTAPSPSFLGNEEAGEEEDKHKGQQDVEMESQTEENPTNMDPEENQNVDDQVKHDEDQNMSTDSKEDVDKDKESSKDNDENKEPEQPKEKNNEEPPNDTMETDDTSETLPGTGNDDEMKTVESSEEPLLNKPEDPKPKETIKNNE
ncbi:high mobility group nucleosome-binding domain-containing protein 5-like isoform X2 [Cyprinodon tularosa]|uniref:high mobility group nucleosome-binding domain-containing protein 5-like isoform X2 n=1 Tax=Cyprinodon tularosa TaxID=77115 RepID=UPI0018E23BEB|nr:high mobility group nucleosome-binding domain-containing protein 5-like isoform X2 [Cyprinodon tularosa]